MDGRVQERLAGASGTALVIALIGYALIAGLRMDVRAPVEEALTLVTLSTPRPPPPEPRRPQPRQPKSGKPSGKAAPANLRNKASAVVAPPPVIPLPVVPPVIAAAKPATGTAPSSGAADRPGLGEGAGGSGDGRGNGGWGDGEGDGGGDTPPRQVRGRLKFSDMPPAMREAGVAGTVSVRYSVEVTGRVDNCIVERSSGTRALDDLTCRLIEQRFFYRPSRDETGRPVRSVIEENHSWIVDRDDDRD
ncbi:energy transducer TonB [Sphingomonas profundi]|uniref:energy transducer TonB n=1 Tax=Alterirhizorhabdus profundi TaxID=2681549 RepID=UPI0018D1A903|nr:TonB family protein [Sphingomonas profundi]